MLDYPWFETVLVDNFPHRAPRAWGSSAQMSNGMISKFEPLAFLIWLCKCTLGFTGTTALFFTCGYKGYRYGYANAPEFFFFRSADVF
jgi:hypothetical protein